jgi:outer membrane protein OmpA-like peptidoglycan-associated protein
MVLVFADNMLQEQVNTWETGTATIHLIPGKDYQLLVKREGYNDKIVNMKDQDSYQDGVEVALIPQDIQRLRPSGIDLTNANMLVMASPDGQEQLYLSTDDNLYKYTVENGNQYLSNDNQKILLEERSRSFDGKRTTKQGSDQFNLRTEDQFLYDELSADEKEMVDKIVEKMQHGGLDQDPDLNLYYQNLPEEYRNLVDYMASNSGLDQDVEESSLIATTKNLNQVLAKNRIAVAEVFNVNNIYYDFDKSNIREDAAVELDKLVAILKSNQNIKVVMFSHTDSRGSNRYNDGLSVKRGKAAIQYLVDQGIEMDRLTAQGKGESQLVNSCLDSIKCSEEAHQLNRRTEFMLSA